MSQPLLLFRRYPSWRGGHCWRWRRKLCDEVLDNFWRVNFAADVKAALVVLEIKIFVKVRLDYIVAASRNNLFLLSFGFENKDKKYRLTKDWHVAELGANRQTSEQCFSTTMHQLANLADTVTIVLFVKCFMVYLIFVYFQISPILC